MIEEISEKTLERCELLAKERYKMLRITIENLYGQLFLEELEANVSGIISRSRYNDTITDRLSLLRKQYRTKCKILNPYNPIGKAAYNAIYESSHKKVLQSNEKHDLRLIRHRSKVRQRYNRLAEVILRDLGEEMQKELIWKSKTLALAEIIQKSKYQKFSWAKGYAENDLSFSLRHLRIMYAYQRELHQERYGTSIHTKINNNYKNGMLDYYKNK